MVSLIPYLVTIIFLIYETSGCYPNGAFPIQKCFLPVLLNSQSSTDKIFMKVSFIYVGISSTSDDCRWTAWKVPGCNMYIFGKQRNGTWYFMKFSDSLLHVTEGTYPEKTISRDDLRLFEYKYQPQSRRHVLRHKVSGKYFKDMKGLSMNLTGECDKAMHIVMQSVSAANEKALQ